ncbi:MAG TPA: 50S ribosomal protein L19e [Nitrosopumilaceae archaeon]|nr:50S ribosomal protein L19e [Nitrosopumilaceae archaeon]
MVVNLRAKKRLVSRIMGVGVNRVRFDSEHLDDIADAITRDNIRSLITANTIKIKPIVGTSRGRAAFKKSQRKKRGPKPGAKKGTRGARMARKDLHMIKVRALRYRLKIEKDRKEITNKEFWQLYKMIGGNTVRNSAHLRLLLAEIKEKRNT